MSRVFYILPDIWIQALFTALTLAFLTFSILMALWGIRGRKLRYMLPPIILFIVLSSIMGYILYGINTTSISIENEDKLIINAPIAFVWKSIDRDEIARAYIVDWRENTDYSPSIRNLGIQANNYRIGHFTLSNGLQAIIISNRSEVLVIETKNGESILLGPNDFEEFTEALNAILHR